jgi:hypothetical protein
MNKTMKGFAYLSLCLMLLVLLSSEAFSLEQSPQASPGTILINIMGRDYHDFAFHLSTRTLKNVAKGKIVKDEKDGKTFSVCQGSNYKYTWDNIRGKQYLDEDKFKIVFEQIDLPDQDTLFRYFNFRYDRIADCNPKESYQLKKRNAFMSKEIYPSNFTVNEQKSFAVYSIYPGGPGLLIDFKNMTMSKAFCNRPVDKSVWDKTGQYLAYTTSSTSKPHEVITIKDVKNVSVLMVQHINKHVPDHVWNPSSRKIETWNPPTREFEDTTINSQESLPSSDYNVVADIAWNPSSEYIAVLTYTSRIGLWPWELLTAAMGHPIPYNTFYLSIYDTKGKKLLTHKVIGDVVYGRGSLVWID